MKTPHVILRLSRDDAAALRRIAAEVVPDDERPPNAPRRSGWQLTALLRGLAHDKAYVKWGKEGEK